MFLLSIFARFRSDVFFSTSGHSLKSVAIKGGGMSFWKRSASFVRQGAAVFRVSPCFSSEVLGPGFASSSS